MLRHRADWRTVAYLAFTVGLSVLQWNLDSINPGLYATALFMGVATAVISHNHNHLSMWKSKPLNLFTSYVIALFYGHPAIGWVPTHNQVHHKLNNKVGDSSRSPKVFKRNHLFALVIYPTITGIVQSKEISAFIRGLWKKDRAAFWAAVSEYVVFFGAMAGLLVLDWKKALLFFVIPQQFALFTIQVFNYVQHIEADEDAPWNHSRNFISPLLNALLFNNGYHTVHHLKPGVHWSQTPALHKEHEAKIHPALLQRSWWGYMIYTFIVRPFIPGAAHPALSPALSEVEGGVTPAQ